MLTTLDGGGTVSSGRFQRPLPESQLPDDTRSTDG